MLSVIIKNHEVAVICHNYIDWLTESRLTQSVYYKGPKSLQSLANENDRKLETTNGREEIFLFPLHF